MSTTHFVRIRSLKEIRKLHHSTCSCTWGSGSVAGNRVALSSPSIRSSGDARTVFYCTLRDWRRAFPNTEK